MTKKFTIGIPAHNEEESIERTLRSIIRSKIPADYEREIIVCAHNCKDNTAEIVKKLAEKSSEIKLIELNTQDKKDGRFNPLNTIRKNSDSEIVIFCDADVLIDTWAISRILKDFEKMPHMLAVSGISKPSESRINIKEKNLANIITSLRKKQERVPALHGRVYGIRNKLVPPFPPLILDDLFMSAWTGKDRMYIDPNVKVYSRSPQTLEDYYRRQVVMYNAEKEILETAKKYARNHRDVKSTSLAEFGDFVKSVAESYEFNPEKLKTPLTPEEKNFVELYKMIRLTAKQHAYWGDPPQWVITKSAKLNKMRPTRKK